MKLGDDDFNAGDAEELVKKIDEDGPVLWSALSRGRRIWTQHIGDDPKKGWFAFDARPPGEDESCVVDWDPDRRLFIGIDACDSSPVYPIDGEGLTQFGVWVDDDGDLIVDVNANDGP